MRFGLRYSLLVLLLSAVVSGCAKQSPWTAGLDESYKDDIQELVEEKIDEQSEDRSGSQLWESYKRDDFQPGRDFSRDESRDELEKKRQQTAQRLMGLGPLSLDICLITSLEFNDRIQAGRAAIRAVGSSFGEQARSPSPLKENPKRLLATATGAYISPSSVMKRI